MERLFPAQGREGIDRHRISPRPWCTVQEVMRQRHAPGVSYPPKMRLSADRTQVSSAPGEVVYDRATPQRRYD